jgi:hypothetical protein
MIARCLRWSPNLRESGALDFLSWFDALELFDASGIEGPKVRVGTLSQFRCDPCGYEAEVSGDRDCGMASATVTILCENCASYSSIFA